MADGRAGWEEIETSAQPQLLIGFHHFLTTAAHYLAARRDSGQDNQPAWSSCVPFTPKKSGIVNKRSDFVRIWKSAE